jgi:hypothetical protein
LGANAHSLVLVLIIELAGDGELEILYESIYQGDEGTILVWSTKLGLDHYQWLCGPLFHISVDCEAKLFMCIIRRILKFLQIK